MVDLSVGKWSEPDGTEKRGGLSSGGGLDNQGFQSTFVIDPAINFRREEGVSSEMGVMDCDSRPSYTTAGSGRPDFGVTRCRKNFFLHMDLLVGCRICRASSGKFRGSHVNAGYCRSCLSCQCF